MAIMNHLRNDYMMDAGFVKNVERHGNVIEDEFLVQVLGSTYSLAAAQNVELQSGEDRP